MSTTSKDIKVGDWAAIKGLPGLLYEVRNINEDGSIQFQSFGQSFGRLPHEVTKVSVTFPKPPCTLETGLAYLASKSADLRTSLEGKFYVQSWSGDVGEDFVDPLEALQAFHDEMENS